MCLLMGFLPLSDRFSFEPLLVLREASPFPGGLAMPCKNNDRSQQLDLVFPPLDALPLTAMARRCCAVGDLRHIFRAAVKQQWKQ